LAKKKTTSTTTQASSNETTIKSEFSTLDTKRQTLLQRARDCSAITIPSLLPPQGSNENTKLNTPYQSFGARGVNNLSAKLLLALLPPNSPFFKMSIPDAVAKKVTLSSEQTDYALSQTEKAIQAYIEAKALRVPAFTAIKLLVATGNALCYLPEEGGMKVYKINQYVVRRDPMGNVLMLITKELVSPEAIEDEQVRNQALSAVQGGEGEKYVEVYTKCWLQDKKWNVIQEIGDKPVPGSDGTYPVDESPWIPLRWSALEGEDYGRGHVDEYLGDLNALEGLSQAILESTAAAAKLLFLVNPNGVTDARDLVDTPNLGFATGRKEDVSTLQSDKYNDLKVALDAAIRIEERLSQAFLLNSSVQRKAERVTAEEIRYMASELEEALGGIYSILSQEFQRPLLMRVMALLKRTGGIPNLPKDSVDMVITTGLEALGRGHDLNKLVQLGEVISKVFGPEVLSQNLIVTGFITRAGTSLGIDMDGLVKPPQDMAQEQQDEQMNGMAGQIIPGVAQEAVKGIVQQQVNAHAASLLPKQASAQTQ
jgi:hypothetical protein